MSWGALNENFLLVSIVGKKHTVMSSCLPFINVLISCTAYPFVILWLGWLKETAPCSHPQAIDTDQFTKPICGLWEEVGGTMKKPTYIQYIYRPHSAAHHHVLNGNNWGRPNQNVFHVLLSKPDTRSPAITHHFIWWTWVLFARVNQNQSETWYVFSMCLETVL